MKYIKQEFEITQILKKKKLVLTRQRVIFYYKEVELSLNSIIEQYVIKLINNRHVLVSSKIEFLLNNLRFNEK
jgi:hypothetical protein